MRNITKAPNLAIPILIVIVLIGALGILFQIIVFPRLSDHAEKEQIFWVISNLELLVPGAVTAVLAWLTYTLIRSTLEALDIARRQADDTKDALVLSKKQMDITAELVSETKQRNEFDKKVERRKSSPFIDIDSSAPTIEIVKRAFFSINRSQSSSTTRWQPESPEFLANSYDAEAIGEKGSIALATSLEFECKLRNIGPGVAHVTEIAIDGFTWMQQVGVLKSSRDELSFRSLMPIYQSDRLPSIKAGPVRVATLMPALGEQPIRIKMNLHPSIVPSKSNSITKEATLVGLSITVEYKAIHELSKSKCQFLVFFKETYSGSISEYTMDHFELGNVDNTVIGIDVRPTYQFFETDYEDWGLPSFDRDGETLIIDTIDDLLMEGLSNKSDEYLANENFTVEKAEQLIFKLDTPASVESNIKVSDALLQCIRDLLKEERYGYRIVESLNLLSRSLLRVRLRILLEKSTNDSEYDEHP